MPTFTSIFFVLGGVVLTIAWDRDQRVKVLNSFGINSKVQLDEFGDRHREVATAFEIGKCSLDEYLNMTLFGLNQIDRESFKKEMYAQSQRIDGFEVLKKIAESEKYFLSTLNNESRELNDQRIRDFELKKYFKTFCSSCYLNMAKPTREIYEAALNITQRRPDECVFIDDRPQNAESARRVGIHAVAYQSPGQLTAELGKLGVSF